MLTIDTIPLKLVIPDSEFQITNLEFGIWNLESTICSLDAVYGSGSDGRTF